MLKGPWIFIVNDRFGSHQEPPPDCDLALVTSQNGLLTTRLVLCDEQSLWMLLKVVCPLFMTCGDWLILIDSLTCLSLWLYSPCQLLLPPIPSHEMVSPRDTCMIHVSQCIFVKIGFRWLSLWPGVYLWYSFGINLMFTQSHWIFCLFHLCI